MQVVEEEVDVIHQVLEELEEQVVEELVVMVLEQLEQLEQQIQVVEELELDILQKQDLEQADRESLY